MFNKATELIQCDEGCKTMVSHRTSYGIPRGQRITVEHVVVILLRCNFQKMARKFEQNEWLKVNKRDNDREAIRRTLCEIAHWNKLLVESIVCFGGKLRDGQYVYHGVSHRVTVKDVIGIDFNVAISCTTQFSVAKGGFANDEHHGEGICLKLGRMPLTKDVNYVLDVADFSDYPNEREVLLFGDKLCFADIVYDGMTHRDDLLSLQLYVEMISDDALMIHFPLFPVL